MKIMRIICKKGFLLAAVLLYFYSFAFSEPIITEGYVNEHFRYLESINVFYEYENWLGLFIDKENPRKGYLKKVEISIEPEGKKYFGNFTFAIKPKGAKFIFTDIPNLSTGPVLNIKTKRPFDLHAVDDWFSDKNWEIKLDEKVYTLRLHTPQQDIPNPILTLSKGKITQTLFDSSIVDATHFDIDGPHFELHWAGDIDGDNLLDMIVTFSRKYSYHPVQLLLSSEAQEGELVSEVADSKLDFPPSYKVPPGYERTSQFSRIFKKYDADNDVTFYSNRNLFPIGEKTSPISISLISINEKLWPQLVFTYEGEDWIFIEKVELIHSEGERINFLFDPDRPGRDGINYDAIREGSQVRERIQKKLDVEEAEELHDFLSKPGEISLRMSGTGYQEYKLTLAQTIGLVEMLEMYLN
ncbi:MAG: hypothetical protein ACQESB_06810 [Elusimicrobiota bacterium]